MSVESLIGVFSVLLTISLAAERLIEILKPLYEKIKDATWKSSAKLLSAVVIGTALAALFRFDMLDKLAVEAPFLVGYLAAGLIASTGSTTINRFLDWLKTLQNDTKVTIKETTYIEEDKTIEKETVTSNKVVQ